MSSDKGTLMRNATGVMGVFGIVTVAVVLMARAIPVWVGGASGAVIMVHRPLAAVVLPRIL